jgi:hypothetical protein
VDAFVRTAILSYPSLYKSRTDVLHDTLCVPGNGYEWGADGTIVSTFEEPSVWTKETAIAEMEGMLSSSPDAFRDLFRAEILADIEDCAEIVEQVDTRMHLHHKVPRFAQQSQFALLHTAPENVSPEWKQAIKEMRREAKAAGWKF